MEQFVLSHSTIYLQLKFQYFKVCHSFTFSGEKKKLFSAAGALFFIDFANYRFPRTHKILV